MATKNIRKADPDFEFPTEQELAEMVQDMDKALAIVLLTTITLSHENLTDGYHDKKTDTQKYSPALPAFKILQALQGIDLGMPFREAMLKLQLSGHILQRGGAYIPACFDDGKSSKLRRAETTPAIGSKIAGIVERLQGVGRTKKTA